MNFFTVVALMTVLVSIQLSVVESTCTYAGVEYPEGARMDSFILGMDMCQGVYCTNGQEEWRLDSCPQSRSLGGYRRAQISKSDSSYRRTALIEKILKAYRNL